MTRCLAVHGTDPVLPDRCHMPAGHDGPHATPRRCRLDGVLATYEPTTWEDQT